MPTFLTTISDAVQSSEHLKVARNPTLGESNLS